MTRIHIQRPHQLGLTSARQVAAQWVEQAETQFDMRCAFAQGPDCDEIQFSRSGVQGTLKVSADRFELDAQLGFLLGAFKDRIEGEITNNLDALLSARQKKPGKKKAG